MNGKLLGLAALALFVLVTVATPRPAVAAWPGTIVTEVHHNAVLDGQIRVCDSSANMSSGLVSHGVEKWNLAIGANVLAEDCSGTRGVTVIDVATGFCGYDGAGKPKPACADFPDLQDRVDKAQYWTPVPNDPLQPYTLAQKQTIAVHELGHNLGFDHFQGDSIMDDRELPFGPYRYTQPQVIDITHYHEAYTPPYPGALSATAPAPGQVRLNWTDVSWNEESFSIYRDGAWIGTAPRNTGTILLTSQPPGVRSYKMGGNTRADCFGTGGFCLASPEVSVTVTGSIDLRGSNYQILDGGSLTPVEESAAPRYRITITNSGTLAAGGSYAAIKFAGNIAPDGDGICWVPSVPANGGTNYCDTVAVTTDFAGGAISVTADNNGNLVGETDEGNNTWASGATLAVIPRAPTSVQVVPPYAIYQYVDQSSIETNFTVRVEWKSTCSGSTGWSTSSPGRSVTEPLSEGQGLNNQEFWGFPTGKCYRLRVRVNAPYNNAGYVTSSTWFCC